MGLGQGGIPATQVMIRRISRRGAEHAEGKGHSSALSAPLRELSLNLKSARLARINFVSSTDKKKASDSQICDFRSSVLSVVNDLRCVLGKGKFTYEYPRPSLTVDVVLVTRERRPRVLFCTSHRSAPSHLAEYFAACQGRASRSDKSASTRRCGNASGE